MICLTNVLLGAKYLALKGLHKNCVVSPFRPFHLLHYLSLLQGQVSRTKNHLCLCEHSCIRAMHSPASLHDPLFNDHLRFLLGSHCRIVLHDHDYFTGGVAGIRVDGLSAGRSQVASSVCMGDQKWRGQEVFEGATCCTLSEKWSIYRWKILVWLRMKDLLLSICTLRARRQLCR